LLNPDAWVALYHTGAFSPLQVPPNLILVAAVRLLVMVGILLAARVAVGVARRAVARAVHAATVRAGREQRRLVTLQGILGSALSYAIYFVAMLLVLFTVGVTWKALAPLLGAASIVGLAIGFGAQKLVRDVITGLFILGEGQFDVGERVVVNGVSGEVLEIGLRVTRLRDDEGRLYVIANGDISTVLNASRGAVLLAVEVVVARDGAVDAAIEAIRVASAEVLAAHGSPDGVAEVRVTGMDAGKVTLRATGRVPVGQLPQAQDALRRRLLAALDTAGVGLA
jgi:small conductance mechanosensitive channel